MFKPKHTVATVVLTMFAVFLAELTLMLPWWEVTIGTAQWVDGTPYVTHRTFTYYITWDENYNIGEVEGLMRFVAILTGLWALTAIAYVARLLLRDEGFARWYEQGFVAGVIIAAVGLMPILVFALFIGGAYQADLSEYAANPVDSFIGSSSYSSWGPASGWILSAVAWFFQLVAVLLQNVPAVRYRLLGPEKLPPELETQGDLPAR